MMGLSKIEWMGIALVSAGAVCFKLSGYVEGTTEAKQQVWESANAIQEHIESYGERRGSNRDNGNGVRDLRPDDSERGANSRDGRSRHQRGGGEEEGSDNGRSGGRGSDTADEGS